MDDTEKMFKISLEDEMRDVYYFQQISDNKVQLIFKVPWGGAIIRNCVPTGQIFNVRTVKEYEVKKKESNRQFWLFLPLKVFRHQNTLYGVYCCPQCESMAGTDQLSIDQDPTQMALRVCEFVPLFLMTGEQCGTSTFCLKTDL